MVVSPRWLRRVFRTVGLIGEGEMGGRGDLATVVAVGMVRVAIASLGPRRAIMLTVR